METLSWSQTFPRIWELYVSSDRSNRNNYFQRKETLAILIRQQPELYFLELENCFSLMDMIDWTAIKRKAIPYVASRDEWGWYSQLFEVFHEARGHVFLKQQGYTKVHFIPEEPGHKTPDLYGVGILGEALLEAKCVRVSDYEKSELAETLVPSHFPDGEVEDFLDEKISMTDVEHFLSDSLTCKIDSTVRKAETQLTEYRKEEYLRRILYLSIHLNSGCSTKETMREIDAYLDQFVTNIDIEYRIENSLIR